MKNKKSKSTHFHGIKERKSFAEFNKKPKKLTLEEISPDLIGERVIITAGINTISQTSGPTLFSVTDGTGSISLKGFESPGERAYPYVKEEDVIHATIQINEYNGALEGEIKSMEKLTGQKYKEFREKLKSIERKRAKAPEVKFLINSSILDKLKNKFIEAATEIRLAIIQNRPIIVRHHNDADGYSSGFALERAILPLIEKQHGPGKAAWEFYLRAPCSAPFYEIDDSIRDTAMSLRNEAKFSNKMPLIIIADNGSSHEDLLAIQQGKVHGINFIVIDHHPYGEDDVISKEVTAHINPFLVGESGEKFSAGMLCTEIARFINPDVKNIEQIPAIAGLADRTNNPKAINSYLKIAEKQNYTRQLLLDIADVIDFVSVKVRFMEAREYIEVLFGEPRHRQRSLVKLMAPYIRGLENKGIEIAKTAVQTEKINNTTLQILFVEETFPRGFYPKPGKCNGLLHDYTQKNKTSNLVSAGVGADFITIRATDEANFSVHNFINFSNKKLPEAFVEGGGHKNAGAVRFVPALRTKVLNMLREFIKNSDNLSS